MNIINLCFSALFMLCYAYQVVFIIISLFKRPRKYEATDQKKKYAFVISARNEEAVIGQLCTCIKNQDYPAENLGIYPKFTEVFSVFPSIPCHLFRPPL